ELAVPLVVDARPDEVGGHEIGRELHPLELARDRLSYGLHRERLREARHALDEEVPAREERDDDPLQEFVLSDDHLLDLEQEALHLTARSSCHRHRSCLPTSFSSWIRG